MSISATLELLLRGGRILPGTGMDRVEDVAIETARSPL
jgi:hypothetical protein